MASRAAPRVGAVVQELALDALGVRVPALPVPVSGVRTCTGEWRSSSTWWTMRELADGETAALLASNVRVPQRAPGRLTATERERAGRSPTRNSGQLRALLDRHTCVGGGEGTGWDPHEFRHSGLTHLGEQDASLLPGGLLGAFAGQLP
ncbi:hypothetical protein OG580_35820 [Streptomyces sp. NBC_00094]|nr:hypothetical protein [Streptomyces sp. NBC_00094]